MVALDVTDPRVVDVIGVGSTGTGNEPVLLVIILLVIIPLVIILALIIVLPLMLCPDNVAVVDGVITPDIIGTVEVVPRMAEGVGMLVVVPRMAEGVGIIVVLPGPTMSVRVGRVVTPDTAPIAPHEAEEHTHSKAPRIEASPSNTPSVSSPPAPHLDLENHTSLPISLPALLLDPPHPYPRALPPPPPHLSTFSPPTTATMVQENIVIAIIIIVLFVILAIIGYVIYAIQNQVSIFGRRRIIDEEE
ncbi:hypothetical protein MMC18_008146 [Xylographa bjoerkii]|nr:hypothetical protein [Xylographa bjoerkii]